MESQETSHLSEEELETRIASFKLQNSYIGIVGQGIEPVIQPWVTIGKLELQ